jgi:hypothetical protein
MRWNPTRQAVLGPLFLQRKLLPTRRLTGNYSGLASSLEFGRVSPNVSRLFDLPFQPFTLDGQPIDGRLPTDRPHVLKAYGAYEQKWGGGRNQPSSQRSRLCNLVLR